MKDLIWKKVWAYLFCAFMTCLMIRYMLFCGFETGGYHNASYRCLNFNHTQHQVEPLR